jgi:hypothetical protein
MITYKEMLKISEIIGYILGYIATSFVFVFILSIIIYFLITNFYKLKLFIINKFEYSKISSKSLPNFFVYFIPIFSISISIISYLKIKTFRDYIVMFVEVQSTLYGLGFMLFLLFALLYGIYKLLKKIKF